uniref:Egg protein CP391S-like protein n=1 Tax=Schistosoma mansoni TaxID=6183 RepID=A0AA82N7R8_SCHMA
MRYNFSPTLWVLIYLISVWPYKRFNCNDICKNSDLRDYEIVIIENDTYRYSLHYNYSMRIQRHQSQPNLSGSFKNMVKDIYAGFPRFSFTYYGSNVRQIDFYKVVNADDIVVFGSIHLGDIVNNIQNYTKLESEILDEEELLGVKRNFSVNVNGSEVTATMTSLIHPNGKMSLYYDNIPTEIEQNKLRSLIYGRIACENGHRDHEIPVSAKWIKSGTLVEFEVIGKICSQYNTSERCQNATTSNMTCIWCEKGNACIESNDQNTHGMKVKDCRVEDTSTGNNGRK